MKKTMSVKNTALYILASLLWLGSLGILGRLYILIFTGRIVEYPFVEKWGAAIAATVVVILLDLLVAQFTGWRQRGRWDLSPSVVLMFVGSSVGSIVSVLGNVVGVLVRDAYTASHPGASVALVTSVYYFPQALTGSFLYYMFDRFFQSWVSRKQRQKSLRSVRPGGLSRRKLIMSYLIWLTLLLATGIWSLETFWAGTIGLPSLMLDLELVLLVYFVKSFISAGTSTFSYWVEIGISPIQWLRSAVERGRSQERVFKLQALIGLQTLATLLISILSSFLPSGNAISQDISSIVVNTLFQAAFTSLALYQKFLDTNILVGDQVMQGVEYLAKLDVQELPRQLSGAEVVPRYLVRKRRKLLRLLEEAGYSNSILDNTLEQVRRSPIIEIAAQDVLAQFLTALQDQQFSHKLLVGFPLLRGWLTEVRTSGDQQATPEPVEEASAPMQATELPITDQPTQPTQPNPSRVRDLLLNSDVGGVSIDEVRQLSPGMRKMIKDAGRFARKHQKRAEALEQELDSIDDRLAELEARARFLEQIENLLRAEHLLRSAWQRQRKVEPMLQIARERLGEAEKRQMELEQRIKSLQEEIRKMDEAL